MAKKKQLPDPKNSKEAREWIWNGLGWFVVNKPLAFWPLLGLLGLTNGTAWWKALTDDTVTIKPVGAVHSSIMPQAIAGEKPFKPDTAWVILKWQGEDVLRFKTPKGKLFDVDFPAIEKMR